MSAETLSLEYRNRFEGLEPYRERVWDVLTRNWFQQFVRPTDRVLDLGAGWGEFIRHIDCADRLAMDLNPDTARRVGTRVRMLQQDCSNPWQLENECLDVVFTSNFFEHLPDKPALERTLTQARRCLRPGGRLICLGPNIRFLGGAYWDFWDHHLALSERSLSEILEMTGLTVTTCIERFLPYSMSQGCTPPLILLKLYLRLPFAWRFFGRQFLVVARKPVADASGPPV